MPIREYDCGKCGKHYEKLMPGFTPQPITCECGEQLAAKMSASYVPKKSELTDIAPSGLEITCEQVVRFAKKVKEETHYLGDGMEATVADYRTIAQINRKEFN